MTMATEVNEETEPAKNEEEATTNVLSFDEKEQQGQQPQFEDYGPSRQCKSVIAVGGWRIPDMTQQSTSNATNNLDVGNVEIPFDDGSNKKVDTEEEFVCELKNGVTLPISATTVQMSQLRTLLNEGTLVSAESSVEVDVSVDSEDIESIVESGSSTSTQISNAVHVTLPPGSINIISGNNSDQRSRKLASYNGDKKTLVVRVTDIDGRSVNEDAAYISDKFFGTYGDTMTMKSGFDACSFGKFTVTNDYEGQVDTSLLSAPGVVDGK